MYTVTWTRWGRAAGNEVFNDRPAALQFFNRIRRQNGVTRAELKPS
jgi:hypothetical protein